MNILRNACDHIVTVPEGSSCQISGTFLDQNGNTVLLNSIVSFELTLLNRKDREVINDRDSEDVLNTGIGEVDEDGDFIINLTPDDNVILDTDLTSGHTESHIVKLEWSWIDATGTQTGIQEFVFQVEVL